MSGKPVRATTKCRPFGVIVPSRRWCGVRALLVRSFVLVSHILLLQGVSNRPDMFRQFEFRVLNIALLSAFYPIRRVLRTTPTAGIAICDFRSHSWRALWRCLFLSSRYQGAPLRRRAPAEPLGFRR